MFVVQNLIDLDRKPVLEIQLPLNLRYGPVFSYTFLCMRDFSRMGAIMTGVHYSVLVQADT